MKKDPVLKTFGLRVKLLLERKNISQAELARMTRLTPAAVSMILNCEREPQLSTAYKIAQALNVKLSYLVDP